MLDCGNYTKILEQNYKNPGQFNPTSDFTLNECARINYKLVSKLLNRVKWKFHAKFAREKKFICKLLKIYSRELLQRNMFYSINRSINFVDLEITWLGNNNWYMFIFGSILNTVFATVMPLVLLFYLNISTVLGKYFS